jgi:hypothetical protein
MGHSDPYFLIRTHIHPDAEMQMDAGIRQNERVTAAVEKVSRLLAARFGRSAKL